ncbi:MFS transporter [Nocardia sp. NPDC050406]|uniref:MFS transporter n=1 Tax=Nocardia sp. NPDC050406 TaxID=3364318 RepID=UPI0037B7AD24
MKNGRSPLAVARTVRAALHDSPGVVRLAVIRLAGPFGDGVFQAALSGAILFNPERQTDPLDIAAGFAALLLPYSIIGPYAGALLDRWDRRTVLLLANALRAVLIGVTAVLLAAGLSATPLLLLALAVVGIGRFVGAGCSAALPRVLAQRWLVTMNSVMATTAAGCAIVGASLGFAIVGWTGGGDSGSAAAVAVSAVGSLVGLVAAAGFRTRALGPDESERDARSSVRAIANGLRNGAVAAWRSRAVTTAMIGIGSHRMVFGADTLLMVLVLRRGAGEDVAGRLADFGVAIACAGAGMLAAAVIAPLLIPRLGRSRTVVAGLTAAIMVQLALVTPITVATGPDEARARLALLTAAFLLGLAGQIIKLTGDAAMQIEIDDAHRGQVFALQDTVFNIGFVLAVAATSTVIPADGRSVAVVAAAAGIYGCGLAAIALNSRRRTDIP